MTRTDAVLAAVRQEIEAWRSSLEAAPNLRCVTVLAMLTPDGNVRTVLVRPEGERNRERVNGGSARL